MRPTPNAPYTEAITHFARGLGAARGGKPADAAVEIERLAAIKARMLEMKDAYWAEQVDIQRRVVEAWKVYAEGDKAEGHRAAVGRGRRRGSRPTSRRSRPGPIAPARELLGFMLLDAGRAKEAQAAFQTTMTKEPGRFLGLYGAGRAAEASGDKAAAAALYKKLLEQAGAATTDRQSLARARQQTASR